MTMTNESTPILQANGGAAKASVRQSKLRQSMTHFERHIERSKSAPKLNPLHHWLDSYTKKKKKPEKHLESISESSSPSLVCGWLPWTPAVQSLFKMFCLIAGQTTAQTIFALDANSKSLLADSATMVVDCLSYLGNIVGEASTVPATKKKLSLIFSFISILLLVIFNTYFFIQVLDPVLGLFFGLDLHITKDDDDDDDDGVNATIVMIFSTSGLMMDIIGLYGFWVDAKKEAEIEEEDTHSSTSSSHSAVKKPTVNLLSALLHVGADLMRSISTFVEGIVLCFVTLSKDTQSMVDSVATFFICIVVYMCSMYALHDWIVEMKKNHGL